jgi:protein-tyrosine phosphatase
LKKSWKFFLNKLIENPFDVQSEENSKINVDVDLHSHLIPGIDDGSKSMEESIALISRMKELGYKKLITTPHTMSHRYPNSSNIILDGLFAVREELSKRKIDIRLEVASEYYLDEHFISLLNKKDILTFNGNYLLFEMSYVMSPANLNGMVFRMFDAGYQPVLAHPERYVFMHQDFSRYESLKDMGVLFQMNINSLGGYYSKEVKKVAEKLSDSGMINFVGSDTHKMSHLERLEKNLKSTLLQDVFANNTILNNTLN